MKYYRIIFFYFLKLFRVKLTKIEINGYRMLLDLRVKGISRTLFINKSREIDQTSLIMDFVKPGMACLDLGANIGYYALLFAMLTGEKGKVFAIEPDSRNLPLLKKNIELNGWSNIIVVINSAIGASDGEVNFFQDKHSNLSRIDFGNFMSSSQKVKVLTLNSIGNFIGPVDVIRMDIEGAELFVLSDKNFQYLSNLRKGTKIFVEIHPKFYSSVKREFSFESMVNNLYNAGFKKYDVVSSGKEYSNEFNKLNYKPTKKFIEHKWKRYLFEQIKKDDLIYLSTKIPKIVRYIILEK